MDKFKDKFNTLKEKFKPDKYDDRSLKLPYDTNPVLNNVAFTKELCSEIIKIGSHGIVTYSITNNDKKTKKSLHILSALFTETYSKFPDILPIRGTLSYSALVLTRIGGITKEFEDNLKQQVFESLKEIETDCIEIEALRKSLQDLRKDEISFNERLERICDQSNPDEQKAHLLKNQIDEIKLQFENVSDLYLLKILQFESSTFERAQAIHDMIILRKDYHEKCHTALIKIIPEVDEFMKVRRIPLSFKCPLDQHLRDIKKCIAYPLEKCITALSCDENLRKEGLFRVSGGKWKSNLLCSALNIMKFDEITYDWSADVLADALKRYLREMPVSLLSKVNHIEWEKCFEKSRNSKKDGYKLIKDLLNQMPKCYYVNLEFLIKFLNSVVKEKSHNLMNIPNICTVFTPNLFGRVEVTAGNSEMNMDFGTGCSYVLEALLIETDFFFPPNHGCLPTSPRNHENHTVQNEDNSMILFRNNYHNTSGKAINRTDFEVRSQRRRQKCIDSNIINASESLGSEISNLNSITSISSEFSSIESPFPIVPPRRNKNL